MKIDLEHDGVEFGLDRFVAAQSSVYASALAEIKAMRKRTHWMWFIFPQLRGLGSSEMADYFGISGLEEAKAYMAHTQLGGRLVECTLAMCEAPTNDVQNILGRVDAEKFGSCMTIFEIADQNQRCFADALRKFFNGERDHRTLTRIKTHS